MFQRWFTLHDKCGVCSYAFENDPGETWGFWIVLDRLFLLFPLALLVWGWRASNWYVAGALFLVLVVPLIWTMPNRWGVCIGLEYLSRDLFETGKICKKEDS